MIPKRSEVDKSDQWDLSSLYPDDPAWEKALEKLATYEKTFSDFTGTLGSRLDRLLEFLDETVTYGLLEERLGYYAMLKQSEDAGNSANQDRYGRFMSVAAKIGASLSFSTPEILAIPQKKLEKWLETPKLFEYRISLNKTLRFRDHTLTTGEERLLSLQAESSQTATRTFSALMDVDMEFGEIETPEGARVLTQSTLASLLEHKERGVRRRASTQFYSHIDRHKNTLSALYNGSIQQDIYRARVRNYESSLSMHLFPDDVPEMVYDNLVTTVRDNLGLLHRYYNLRKRVLGLKEIELFDMKVPLVPEIKVDIPYNKSVETVLSALQPLGTEYVDTLHRGLLGRWVDRYENAGKRSGAFSAGSYVGEPFILLNYKNDTLRDTFTLAHEAGHSMHSWYSVRHNPFQHYQYTIFEAEVASTFNEQLLLDYLLKREEDPNMLVYLLNKSLDDIIGTLFRQTMFAEYERTLHRTVEEGAALTVDTFRNKYRELLEAYFGPAVSISETADLEGLRIPHFYRAFYVYKYATGIAAAISLSRKVLEGTAADREEYFAFLKSGGSRYPLESLNAAGVDMRKPEPLEVVMELFDSRLTELERSMTL